MRLAGLRSWRHAGEPEHPHEPLHAFAIDATALRPQREDHAPTPVEGPAGLLRIEQTQEFAIQIAQLEGAVNVFRFLSVIEAHTRSRSRRMRQGRELSAQHLHRAAVGDPRIFRRRDDQPAPNTAMHLLIDLSGSMAGGADRLALDAAMALALALEPIRGVSRAVTAFPDRAGAEQQVTQLLSHGERVATHAGAFVQTARGSTPMTGALWFAAADLLARPEPRKVLLTLTDGVLNDTSSASALIQQAQVAGVELIGIGIARDVSRLFPVAIRIESIEDLKAELFRVAERLLLSTHH
jgi:cobalamin biosynthesis protein CobT